MVTTAQDHETQEMVALNGDIVGYNKLLADDFDTTSRAVEKYEALVRERIHQSRGTLVNFVGDNFMAVFDGAKDAMQAAIGITTSIEDFNADLPRQRQVRFRLGIDEGAVAATDGQYFGDALNIAARIQSLAQPGGVSISGRVYRSLDEPALRFRPTGRKELKNIPEKIEVYRFMELPTDGGAPKDRGRLSLENPTIAVFPINTAGADPSVAAAGEMIRADLIHRLASIPNLNVVDATGEIDLASMDRSVPYLIETGLHQLGTKVRVYAKLIDAATMNIMSSDRWDADIDDLFALSDEVSESTARSIEVELIIGEPARLYNELDDPEAIQQIYVGWYHLTTGTPEGWRKARELFEQVAEKHPDEPVGHSLSAYANWGGATSGLIDQDSGLEMAFEQAARGIELGDPTGMSNAVQAAILLAQGRHEEALVKVDEAVITRPTCDVTYALEGSVRRYMGEWEKSLDLVDTAISLTPVVKPWYPTIQACSLFMGNRLEQASVTAEAVLENQPNNLEALLVLAATQVRMGMERRAKATAETIRERFPTVDVQTWLDDNPYQDQEMVGRWKDDLTELGLIDSVA